MTKWPLALTVAALACADAASPRDEHCTRANTGSPCAQGTTAALTNGVWQVQLRTTVVDQTTYNDDGFVCVRTNTRCISEECNFVGVASWTAGQAIAECRERFGR